MQKTTISICLAIMFLEQCEWNYSCTMGTKNNTVDGPLCIQGTDSKDGSCLEIIHLGVTSCPSIQGQQQVSHTCVQQGHTLSAQIITWLCYSVEGGSALVSSKLLTRGLLTLLCWEHADLCFLCHQYICSCSSVRKDADICYYSFTLFCEFSTLRLR